MSDAPESSPSPLPETGSPDTAGHDETATRTPMRWAALALSAVLGVLVIGAIVAAAFLAQVSSSGVYEPPAPSEGAAVAAEAPVARGKDCQSYPLAAAVTCLEQYLETLGSQGKFTEALAELKTLMDDASANSFARPACHSSTHTLGRLAFEQAGSVEKAFDMGDSTCNMGFYHGVVEGLGDAVETPDDLLKEVPTVCSPFPAGERFEVCTHGIGHAAMKAYANELDPSVSACLLLDEQAAKSCLTGAFMEWVNMFSKEGYTPVLLPRNELLTAPLEDMYPPGLCLSLPDSQQDSCFNEMFQTLSGHATVEDMAAAAKWCKDMQDCVEGIGVRLPFILAAAHQSAYDVCQAAASEDLARSCIEAYLESWVSYTHTEEELNNACAQLPARFASSCEVARQSAQGSALLLE